MVARIGLLGLVRECELPVVFTDRVRLIDDSLCVALSDM